MIHPHKITFIERLQNSIQNRELIKLVLSNKREKSSNLKTIIITCVSLKKGYLLNFVYRHTTKDITKNYEITEGIAILNTSLDEVFYNADLYSNTEDLSLILQPTGKALLRTKAPSMQALTSFNHDKIKERLIQTKENIYLRELGITNANWEIRREMSDKYIQINQYIELLEPNLTELSITNNYHIVDMGCGKGYLTFALYDYLTKNNNNTIQMTGVEYREDLVQTCNAIAAKSNFANLKFVKGSIEKTELEHIDILIALHACDTATDDAIFRGIQSNSSLIVCAPCCHKQIRKEFHVSNELSHVMKFGILKERQAEIITDSLRALIMEAYGYKTKVFEFISGEHTPKNVMIVGQKVTNENPNKQEVLSTIAAIKKMFGIKKHYLEILLGI